MLQTQPLEVKDFSLGKTDNYVSGLPNEFKEGDNLILTSNAKLLTRPGSVLVDSAHTVPGFTGSNFRHSAIMSFSDQLFELIGNKMYFNDSGYSELVGPSSNHALSGDATNYPAFAIWNDHLLLTNDAFGSPMKIYRNESDVFQIRTMGMPALATDPNIAGTAGANNYIYRFLYFFQYQIGTNVFQDFGPVTEVDVASVNAPNVNTINITSIPVISNGTTENYDTANIKVKIYRTQNNGTTFTYVDEVTNGTTSYADTSSDASIVDNVPIYTEGGVVDNDPPPKAKYLVVANDCCWYMHVKEGAQIVKNRIRQSIAYDIDSCPGSFFVDVEEEIVGAGAIGIYPLVFCKNNKIYRLEGTFDSLGRGSIIKREITRSIGCTGHLSIVNTRDGVFFAGNDSFYVTDGYSVTKISENLTTTYQLLVDTETKKKRIYGVFDNIRTSVVWAIQQNESSSDNDSWFTCDLRWGVRKSSTFLTASGADNFAPTALAMHNNQLIRGDKRGYAFVHDASYFTDPRVDTTVDPSTWEEATIIYNYESCALNFGTDSVRKWVSSIIVAVDDATNVSIAVNAQNDDSALYRSLKEIRSENQLIWGDPQLIWGTATYIWNFNEVIEANRRFPADSLRCMFKQIQFTNSYTNIYKSDDFEAVTVDGSLKTATLINFSWPSSIVDYYISFENDSYVQQFKILSKTSLVASFQDTQNNAPTGSYKWLIKGYVKGEIMNLISYVVRFAPLTDTQKFFKGEFGTNA